MIHLKRVFHASFRRKSVTRSRLAISHVQISSQRFRITKIRDWNPVQGSVSDVYQRLVYAELNKKNTEGAEASLWIQTLGDICCPLLWGCW